MSTSAPAKSGSGLKIVLIVLVVIFVLFLIFCGGAVALLWVGATAVQKAAGEEFKKQLDGHPVIVAEIGEDFTMTMDIMETSSRAQEGGETPTMVFTVEGEKGEGTITAEPGPGTNQLKNVKLETSDGRVLDIELEDEPEEILDSLDPGDLDIGIEVSGEEGTEAGTEEVPESGTEPEAGESASSEEGEGT